MKRLVVFSVYDYEGHVDDYIIYMLHSFKKISERIVVVSNGKIKNKEAISNCVDQIYERDNIGYDFGAYKDYFTIFESEKKVKEYDEIIIANDTFYGPFIDWEEVFERMELTKCDCWGLTRKANNFKDAKSKIISNYIQTYFLCFGKRIIEDSTFFDFWKKTDYPYNSRQNVMLFEIGINEWLLCNGYNSLAYLDICGGEKYAKERLNPYGDYAYEIISECKFPIMKRHAISILYWGNMMRAIKYVEDYTDYDTNMLWNNWKRYNLRDNRNEPNIFEFKEFCDNHSKIYIYGNGLIGRRVLQTARVMGYIDAQSIVTKRKVGEKVKEIGEIIFGGNDGVIVAVDQVLQDELLQEARKYVDEDQILIAMPR
ncbi:MAG: hypothetical protein E7302_17905 [Butyrivibrio sp.]|nr:hypothetical protein [Butyrivibrio sp.]